MASRPWSPLNHQLFSPPAREFVANIAAIRIDIETQVRPAFVRVRSWVHVVDLQGRLPYLPLEIWMHIASFVSRSWFPPSGSTHAIAYHPQLRYLQPVLSVFALCADISLTTSVPLGLHGAGNTCTATAAESAVRTGARWSRSYLHRR
jgi:hypothetical protein